MQDTNGFKEIMRMNFEHFKEIINLIELDIMPQEIVGGNKVISAAERLTIRFLALGESFGLLSFQFRISNRAASYAIKSICNALVKCLVPLYLRVKSTKEEWLLIAEKFENRWQYPNAIEPVDGKHVIIHKPNHGRSHYHNYKHTHSAILIAIAGPSFECLYVDVGTNGRVNDGRV